jgi:hypothetical protein
MEEPVKRRIGVKEATDIVTQFSQLLQQRNLDSFECMMVSSLLHTIFCKAASVPSDGAAQMIMSTFKMVDDLEAVSDARAGHA